MPREPWPIRRIQYKDLLIKPQWRGTITDYYPEKIIGFDTETYRGKALLLADNEGAFSHPTCFLDCLFFLTRRKNRGGLGWFFNLEYDVSAMLKWLDEKTVSEFSETETMEFYDGPTVYKLKYIRKKSFSIIVNKNTFEFFDVHNFFAGSLDFNAKKYLGKSKTITPVDWSKSKPSDFKKPEMIQYCIDDCIITKQLADLLIETCNGFGIFSKAYYSEASLAAHYFRQKCEIPRLSEISRGKADRIRHAWQAYRGGWIQTFKRGTFDDVTVYDINSAYPAAIANLPDLKRGRFVYRHGSAPPPADAHLGWMDVRIYTDFHGHNGAWKNPYGPHFFNPVGTYIPPKGMNYYFRGCIRSTITKLEYDCYKKYFEIEPITAYYWIPSNDLKFIYRDVINELYSLKSKYKKGDPNFYKLTKILMNGFYGKLIQKTGKRKNGKTRWHTGQLFNPFHGSYVTAHCRVEVFRFIHNHVWPETVISVATDSVATTKPPYYKRATRFGKGLGQWSKDASGRGVFLGSGMYTIQSEDGSFKTAGRGFKGFSHFNFFDLLKENYLKDKIELPQTIRLSYKEALRLKKYDRFNVIENGFKFIGVNMDRKRKWVNDFVTCGDALQMVVESEPFHVNMGG